MRQIACAVLVAALAVPAAAQDAEPDVPAPDEGSSLMEEGARLFFRGLMSEMEPAMRDFSEFAGEAGPAMQLFLQEMGDGLRTVIATVDDLRHYQAPEFLPNGDIIIRRKPDAPTWVPPDLQDDVGPGEEIEL